MVNAGALVTADLVRGAGPTEKIERILASLRAYAGDAPLEVDAGILDRELDGADRNRATAYLMRAQGMIAGDVEDALRVYLSQCAVRVTCPQLASPGLDEYGNGVRGIGVCEEISDGLGLHVFATEAEDALLGRSRPG